MKIRKVRERVQQSLKLEQKSEGPDISGRHKTTSARPADCRAAAGPNYDQRVVDQES